MWRCLCVQNFEGLPKINFPPILLSNPMITRESDIMEFNVLEKTKNSLQIKILDADASVMYPIMEQLLSDDRIEEANYSVEHQELDDPVLYLKAKKGEDPKEILIDNAKSIQEQFSDVFEELFEEE